MSRPARRYGTAKHDWSLEKNHGPVASESALIAASRPCAGESMLGGSICSACESYDCECECSECGLQTIAIVRGRCIPCDDAAQLDAGDAGDSVESLGLGGLVMEY